MPPSGDPGSRFGLAAACFADSLALFCPLPLTPVADPQPTAAIAAIAATARIGPRRRAPDRSDDAA